MAKELQVPLKTPMRREGGALAAVPRHLLSRPPLIDAGVGRRHHMPA